MVIFPNHMIFISPISAAFALAFGGVWTLFYCTKVKNLFGGVTGDTAGFFLQMFELVSMAGVWVSACIVK